MSVYRVIRTECNGKIFVWRVITRRGLASAMLGKAAAIVKTTSASTDSHSINHVYRIFLSEGESKNEEKNKGQKILFHHRIIYRLDVK